MLFNDESIQQARATRASPVAKAVRSTHAKTKDASKRADDGLPLHSFTTLLQDLGTLAYNITHTRLNPNAKIVITTRPTPLQDKALQTARCEPRLFPVTHQLPAMQPSRNHVIGPSVQSSD